VTGMAKTLFTRAWPDRITVNCLAPDGILTDRLRELGASPSSRVGRFGDPAEFAAACAFSARGRRPSSRDRRSASMGDRCLVSTRIQFQ